MYIVEKRSTTGRRVKVHQFPKHHYTPKSAWDMVEWLRNKGGEWVDHDDINSRPTLVDYQVKALEPSIYA